MKETSFQGPDVVGHTQTKLPHRKKGNHLWTYPSTLGAASHASNLSLKREFTSLERHQFLKFC